MPRHEQLLFTFEELCGAVIQINGSSIKIKRLAILGSILSTKSMRILETINTDPTIT